MVTLDARQKFDTMVSEEEEIIVSTKETIRAIRKSTGLSQVGFGIRFGIPRRTIEDWETGRAACPIYVAEMLEALAMTDYHTPRLAQESEEELPQ